ncbi:MAG: sigma-70 family RNA polymerase sigma factor [Phycisphaerales bacterium]|nr:sigma-70 family RNA polymerase sigma factor [Phycisphaerales bacterium]
MASTGPSGPDNPSDASLARAARTGDFAALSTLLERHQTRVFRMCVRVTGDEEAALEATQDTMVRAVRAIKTFDERAQFTTWITRIAINACYSRARSEKLRRHASLDAPMRGGRSSDLAAGAGSASDPGGGSLGSSLANREPGSQERVEEQEARARVLDALSTLDFEARTILILRDGRDLDYDQIAAILGVAVGTVKSRLFRARQALREAIEGNDGAGRNESSTRNG